MRRRAGLQWCCSGGTEPFRGGSFRAIFVPEREQGQRPKLYPFPGRRFSRVGFFSARVRRRLRVRRSIGRQIPRAKFPKNVRPSRNRPARRTPRVQERNTYTRENGRRTVKPGRFTTRHKVLPYDVCVRFPGVPHLFPTIHPIRTLFVQTVHRN